MKSDAEQQFIANMERWKTDRHDILLVAAIHESVGSNTFRAFHGLPQSPSVVFRAWAREWLVVKNKFQTLNEIKAPAQYDKWLERSVESLRCYWKWAMNCDLPIGPSYKIVNLLMKRASRELPTEIRECITKLLHVPLDKYTLAAIRPIATFADNRPIDARATMGHITNLADYICIQQRIRELAQEAGVPPIALDYLAYNWRRDI